MIGDDTIKQSLSIIADAINTTNNNISNDEAINIHNKQTTKINYNTLAESITSNKNTIDDDTNTEVLPHPRLVKENINNPQKELNIIYNNNRLYNEDSDTEYIEISAKGQIFIEYNVLAD